MQKYLFKNISVVNEGKVYITDVFIEKGRIARIGNGLSVKEKIIEIDSEGKYLLPGVIDDQVHFREPGLTDKADIYSESKAGLAGGVTSFMEMPNTLPNALTQHILEDKYSLAATKSLANYSFYMGVSNENTDEVLRTNDKRKKVCGVKIFLGSSTGNMLVDSEKALNRIFSESELLIATHCENEKIIKDNYEKLKQIKMLTASDHPVIRNEAACYTSSSFAKGLAEKYGSRLHILHISTAKEIELFNNTIPLIKKRITAEVCVHHLHFTADDYDRLGYLIKCNPAIKSPENKEALWKGLLDDHLDVIATDHAPHLEEEKKGPYEHAHSGLPLVQHALPLMINYYRKGVLSMEKIVQKMSHSVADCFKIENRGYIREGYFADLVVLDIDRSQKVSKENLLYKCGWSPLEGETLYSSIVNTFVNGHCVYTAPTDKYGNHLFDESYHGERLTFNP